MHPAVQQRLSELPAICQARRVRRLWLFGSAASGGFDPSASDLDLVVEFAAMPVAEYARNYFALHAALEGLFGRPVDLVERPAIRNPYFRRAVEETQVSLYEAA